jgi:hypothetical protein
MKNLNFDIMISDTSLSPCVGDLSDEQYRFGDSCEACDDFRKGGD